MVFVFILSCEINGLGKTIGHPHSLLRVLLGKAKVVREGEKAVNAKVPPVVPPKPLKEDRLKCLALNDNYFSKQIMGLRKTRGALLLVKQQ